MAGKYGTVDPAANSENTARVNMIELWNDSIRRAQEKRQTPVQVAQEQNEAEADLQQKIRNGQVPCPTCASRTYKDQSGDSSVSFQAPKHLSAATAGLAVMNHEHEHVTNENEDAKEQGGTAKSTVTLEYAKCPECGRTYVAGGVTRTIKQADGKAEKPPFLQGKLDTGV